MLLPEIPEIAVWAIYLAPLASFVVIGAALRNRPLHAGRLTIAAVGLSWLLALWALDTSLDVDGVALGFPMHEWLTLFDLEVVLGVRLDGLTAVMLVVVTSVSLMVQIYSTGYMDGDTGYARYFAYMSLFTAAMLGLVVSASLLQLFVHWELVGLASYLLIGFWFHKPSAAAAAKKAFIVTRFGDFGFMLAVLLIWTKTGTFEIAAINEGAEHLSSAVLAGFTLGLFAGAVGKSAQFPLHIWLPDAMEGPTPVSALIHAATMVVAGVYLIARFFPSFEAAPSEVTSTVAYIGGFTAIFAATMGIVATDIKRVLAYSTISQLGYMVMALGLGGYVAAIFHLFTHAFFKALLFLGSGSVNHATNTFDMRRMGGLRHSMPITFWTFIIGALSLSGVFPLAGFWSKDEILLDAYNHNTLLFWVGVTVAGMTAFYMFRAIFLTFFGEYRGGEPPEEPGHGSDPSHPHESPRAMWAPLAILAVPAIGIGWVNLGGDFGVFVQGALPHVEHPFEFHIDSFVLAVSTVFALGGIGLAAAIYYARQPKAEVLLDRLAPVHSVVENKYYMDTIAETVLVRRVLLGGVGASASLFDRYVVDGVVNGIGLATRTAGDAARRVQTGQMQAYTSLMLIGVVVATALLFGLRADQLDRLRDWLGV
ncbi:MAG TPA: NADH-quinone oxidoreductase subunit L [Dehalococcoidia bacterium]|nr:NADH-quinone oxidoreductase subunit L [Dehalococcoidia bacterium]